LVFYPPFYDLTTMGCVASSNEAQAAHCLHISVKKESFCHPQGVSSFDEC
jgi:hypothetical protein